MPAGNKMGPEGEGPLTGKGMGYCAGYPQPGFHHPGLGYHRWARFGRGRRFRNRYFARDFGYGYPAAPGYGFAAAVEQPPTPEEEQHILNQHASWLQEQLDAINSRLQKINKKDMSEE